MNRQKGRGFYKNSLRISDLEDEYEKMKGLHADFDQFRHEQPAAVDSDIVNIESHLHRIAQGAYDICEFVGTKNDQRLSGEFQTAYIACHTYVLRIDAALKLLVLAG